MPEPEEDDLNALPEGELLTHKTDSMERRYNIVDGDDLQMAKELLQNRRKALEKQGSGVTESVTTAGQSAIPEDTADPNKSST